jgi:hypothetical protein
MAKITFTLLDGQDAAAIARYEKAFFRGFGNTPPEDLADIFEYDFKARRLKTKIPYTDQDVYLATVHDVVMAAIAVNFNLSRSLQLETYGFTVPKSIDVAEGLALFSLDAQNGALIAALGEFAYERLYRKGIRFVYGTCERRKLVGYQRIGFEKVDERVHMGDPVYLIRAAIIRPESNIPPAL